MSDCNSVFLVGNLCGDPKLTDITNGKVCNFSIASNRGWNGPEGQKMEEVSFFDCAAFGKIGEVINQYFSKGRKIFIQGRMKQDRWVDKSTEKNKSRVRVVVEDFHFMDNKKIEEGLPPAATGIAAGFGSGDSTDGFDGL